MEIDKGTNNHSSKWNASIDINYNAKTEDLTRVHSIDK